MGRWNQEVKLGRAKPGLTVVVISAGLAENGSGGGGLESKGGDKKIGGKKRLGWAA